LNLDRPHSLGTDDVEHILSFQSMLLKDFLEYQIKGNQRVKYGIVGIINFAPAISCVSLEGAGCSK